MKKSVLFIFVFIATRIFAQTYTWAVTDNTYESSSGNALAVDASGNLFIAETYSNTGMRSGVNIIKYDSNHNFIWKQKIEGLYFGNYFSLAADALGNIYYAGSFADSLFVNNVYTAYGSDQEMLLVKFNAAGVFQFLKQTTGSVGFGLRVSTDALNNVYVGGIVNDLYGSGISFDGTIVYTPSVVYAYIAKYNSAGVFQWVRNGAGNSFSGWGIGMKTDAYNNTYIAGVHNGTVYFGSDTINANGASAQNVFIAKIDASGNWLWARNAGGNNQDAAVDLALDQNGNPYITGFIGSNTATFGTFNLINSSGGDEYFVAKYDGSTGNVLWAEGGGGNGSQIGDGICVDNQGTIYVALNSVYFSRFDNNGIYLGSDFTQAGNSAMTADINGGIYITGNISAPVTFGSYTLTPSQSQQMYVAEFSNSATGVKDLVEESAFSAFPNPTHSIFTLHCPLSFLNCQLEIYNSFGAVVQQQIITSANQKIDLSSEGKGIYFLEMSNGEKREVKKIVLN